MEVRKAFLISWKNDYNIMSVSLYSLIMVAVEKIMEVEFKCPQEKALRALYVASYFSCPAFITFFLSLVFHPACIPCARRVRKFSCSWKTQIIFRAFLPPGIWCVILLCDGRYIDCLDSADEGNSGRSAPQSRAAELPSKLYTISQVLGLFALTAVVTVCGLCHVFPCWFCCKDEERHQREELQSLLEEGARNHIEELKKKDAEQIMEQKVKPSLQSVNFWENMGLRGKVEKKIKEVVESAVRDVWAESQQEVEQGVPLTAGARGSPSQD